VDKPPLALLDNLLEENKLLKLEIERLLETQRKFGTMMHTVMDERDALVAEREITNGNKINASKMEP